MAAMTPFQHVLTTEAEVREIVGEPLERSMRKERHNIDELCSGFITRSPFLLMATSGSGGACDVSPKGDAAGFVKVLDEKRLIIPERNGNRRLDGIKNILVNPQIGLLFLIPGCDYTLRINGRACITRDPELLAASAAHGVTPKLAIGVETEQAFFHCVKSFRRAQLWAHEQWPGLDDLPSYACTLFKQIRPTNATLEDYERVIGESNSKLYV
jgi:PPOX class probable FMN-dependent enzyme